MTGAYKTDCRRFCSGICMMKDHPGIIEDGAGVMEVAPM
jgi:hypothetical protein